MRMIVLAAAAGALALSACASDGYGYGGGRMYGGGDIAYYDGGYGSYYDGYWRNNTYYYRAAPNGRYLRDEGRHFRRDRSDGYREYRGRRGSQWR